MKELVTSFAHQLREAVKIGESIVLPNPKSEIRNVVITGLGGSGIGGSIVSQLLADKIHVPVIVNKDYFLPAFVNENTLVIASSNSGNTEETLSAFNEAIGKGASLVCITSGGKLAELAHKEGAGVITVPGGAPPRSGLGYSIVQLFYVLYYYGLIVADFKEGILNSIELLDKEQVAIKEKAQEIAHKLIGKIPVIYCASNWEPIALRWRQQINENSKMLCWHNLLPELNHNELVGWTESHPDLAVLFLKNTSDYSRSQKRAEITHDIVKKYAGVVIDVYSKGSTEIERAFYHIHLGDWISVFIAEIKNVDVMEIRVIDYLKEQLSKL